MPTAIVGTSSDERRLAKRLNSLPLPRQKITMALVDLIMPNLGESIMEATILKWHKQPGDSVSLDETVLEIATDKVDSEVPSTSAGVIRKSSGK